MPENTRITPETMRELPAHGAMRLRHLPGQTRRLVIAFAGVGAHRAQEPKLEFFHMSQGRQQNHVLFVTDASRSWMNAPGMAEHLVEQIAALRAEHQLEAVVAIGNSMGGTMALILSSLMDIDSVVAIAPQFSVHPRIIPSEQRWPKFRANITDFRFPKVAGLRPERTHYVLLHGSDALEMPHVARFSRIRGIGNFIFPGHGHRLAGALHKRNLLAPVMEDAIAGRHRRMRAKIAAAGGLTLPQFRKLGAPTPATEALT